MVGANARRSTTSGRDQWASVRTGALRYRQRYRNGAKHTQ